MRNTWNSYFVIIKIKKNIYIDYKKQIINYLIKYNFNIFIKWNLWKKILLILSEIYLLPLKKNSIKNWAFKRSNFKYLNRGKETQIGP